MLKRRVMILLIFLLIAVMAVSKTILESQAARDGASWKEPPQQIQDTPQRTGQVSAEPLQRICRSVLDKLLVLSVTLPFLLTAVLISGMNLMRE